MKFRLDYSAHVSVVVDVPDYVDEENGEDKAIEAAESYLKLRGVQPEWELDDGGVEEVDDSCEADTEYIE